MRWWPGTSGPRRPPAGRRIGLLPAAVVAVLVAVLVALTVAGPAATAHDELASSTPADGQWLEALPPRVELVFDDAVAQPVALTVSGPGGRNVAAGPVEVRGRVVSRALVAGAAPDGRYVIGYRVTSSDGHPVAGRIDFGLGPAPAGGASVAVLEGSVDPRVAWSLVAGIVLALAVVTAALARVAATGPDG